jgi:hypothetical protein
MTAFLARIGRNRAKRRQPTGLRGIALLNLMAATQGLPTPALEAMAGMENGERSPVWGLQINEAAGRQALFSRIVTRVMSGEMSVIGFARGRAVAVLIGEMP